MKALLTFFVILFVPMMVFGEDTTLLPYLLGSSSTPLSGSSYERLFNIRKAVEMIQGMNLQPGDIFSFNKKVGKREYSTGYLPAPAIVYEELQPSPGGGICQVASTLFDAVLLSDLPILERHRHHTPINYIPLGMDATVSWGTKDLKFKNSSKGRIQIIGRVTESNLTFEIYGEIPLNDELKLETDIHESPSPFPAQQSEPGMEIVLYRIRLREGKFMEREWIHRDFFPAWMVKSE